MNKRMTPPDRRLPPVKSVDPSNPEAPNLVPAPKKSVPKKPKSSY